MLKHGLMLLIVAGLLAAAWVIPPMRTGDGFEYITVLQSLYEHWSPEIRGEDVAATTELLHQHRIEHGNAGIYSQFTEAKYFIRAPEGHRFGPHFWIYPLCCLPAKYALVALGGNELAALQLTNVILFLAALFTGLYWSNAEPLRRYALVALAGASPVIWYLRWTHTEAFTWAFVLMCLVHLTSGRFGLAALCASIGAMQNPPVVFLVGYTVFLSLFERNVWVTARAAIGGMMSLAPAAYWYYHLGQLNPINAIGGIQYNLISWHRTCSVFVDFNQGLLPYVPLLLVFSAFAVALAVQTRDWRKAGLIPVLLLMIIACEPIINWNCAHSMLLRYAVWMVPVLACLVAEKMPINGWAVGAVAAAALCHGSIIFCHDGTEGCLEHTRFANYILDHYPSIYDPDPEIFAERELHADWVNYDAMLPLAHIAEGGRITKILTDAKRVSMIGTLFAADPAWLARTEAESKGKAGRFYLNPPSGSVLVHPSMAIDEVNSSLRLRWWKPEDEATELRGQHRGYWQPSPSKDVTPVTSPSLTAGMVVSNAGRGPILGDNSHVKHPCRLGCKARLNGKGPLLDLPVRSTCPTLRPSEARVVPISIVLPAIPGRYTIEVTPLLEHLAWGVPSLTFSVEVLSGSKEGYRAEISCGPLPADGLAGPP